MRAPLTGGLAMLLAVLASAAPAAGQGSTPPGNAGVQEYQEQVPSASGGKPPSKGHSGGGSAGLPGGGSGGSQPGSGGQSGGGSKTASGGGAGGSQSGSGGRSGGGSGGSGGSHPGSGGSGGAGSGSAVLSAATRRALLAGGADGRALERVIDGTAPQTVAAGGSTGSSDVTSGESAIGALAGALFGGNGGLGLALPLLILALSFFGAAVLVRSRRARS